jgi:hypothetical protein
VIKLQFVLSVTPVQLRERFLLKMSKQSGTFLLNLVGPALPVDREEILKHSDKYCIVLQPSSESERLNLFSDPKFKVFGIERKEAV